MASEGMRSGDVLTLSVPADTGYVGLVRTLAAGVAGRLDLDLDHIEDMRLAVSEACSVLLADAAPGDDLRLDLHIGDRDVTAVVSAPTRSESVPRTRSFAWTVLSALADDASAQVGDGRASISLRFGTYVDDGEPPGSEASQQAGAASS